MPTLVHLHVSPWSEKARWALEHHRVAHKRIEHVPMVMEPLLRLWMRRPFHSVSVPLLLAEESRIDDALGIARWADERGRGPTLFPREHQSEIARISTLTNRMLDAGRALVTPKLAASTAALCEMVPPPLRRLGRPATVLAAQGVGFVARKYDVSAHSRAQYLVTLRNGLRELQTELGGREHFFGGFTFADILLAVVLQEVAPVSDRFLRIGPGTRACFTQPELEVEFHDLVAWRDELYGRYRLPKPTAKH